MNIEKSTEFRNRLRQLLFVILVCSFQLPLLAPYCSAAEKVETGKTTITSETLLYDEASTTYTAKGRARIQRGESLLEADEIRYNDKTSDATAIENVKYQDRM